jgi:dUTPase
MFDEFYLNFKKLHPDAKIPQRANDTDAGMDVYSISDTVINPGCDALIPLGLQCEFPPGYSMIFKNKSGRSSKDKLGVGACIAGDTLVNTNGGFYRAEELHQKFVKNKKLEVLSYNEKDNIYAFKPFSGFQVVERCVNVIDIEFIDVEESGKVINITVDPGHHFYDFDDGWIEADSLEVGQVINHLKVTKLRFGNGANVYSTSVNDTKNYITSGGLINHNCVVDSEYRGELMTHVFNHGKNQVVLPAGQKITQFVIVPVWCGQPEEVEDIDANTNRGAGGFGSSGVK